MRININRNNLLDIINIKFDVFNPINSFMSKENIISVIESLNLSNNDFFPIPIFFDIDSDCFRIAKKSNFLNIFFNNIKICDLYIESIYELKSKKKNLELNCLILKMKNILDLIISCNPESFLYREKLRILVMKY